jgi:molybdate transport system substrate-binding protein
LPRRSLKEALDEQAKQFDGRHGNKVVISYAASNALARQIEAGAPADVFISADLDWMDYVAQRNLIAPGTASNLLRNTLVLIAPASEQVDPQDRAGLRSCRRARRRQARHGESRQRAAGKYGKSALERLGVWASVAKQVARAENVRAALALVSRGEAPFGVVYSTDALSDKGVRIVDTFPQDTYPPIVYPEPCLSRASPRPANRYWTICVRRPRAPSGKSTVSDWRNKPCSD